MRELNQDCMYFRAFKMSQSKEVYKYLNKKLGKGWDDGMLTDLCADITDQPEKYKKILNLIINA